MLDIRLILSAWINNCDVKCLVKLGKNRKDSYKLLPTVFFFTSLFKKGRESIMNEPCEGHPSTFDYEGFLYQHVIPQDQIVIMADIYKLDFALFQEIMAAQEH